MTYLWFIQTYQVHFYADGRRAVLSHHQSCVVLNQDLCTFVPLNCLCLNTFTLKPNEMSFILVKVLDFPCQIRDSLCKYAIFLCSIHSIQDMKRAQAFYQMSIPAWIFRTSSDTQNQNYLASSQCMSKLYHLKLVFVGKSHY